MGTVVLYHGSGAQDFEIIGEPSACSDASRTMFNARRILVARGHSDAIALLNSVPFALLPATNGFGDDFHILQAEVPLHSYEELRLAQRTYRPAAKQLAETFEEAGGPYIRFVAIGLRLADPETWDVFLCHASDDKETIARPLYDYLTSRGIHCWIDQAEIAWGESIVSKIQAGLTLARYVIVILSPRLLQKKWAPRELQSALTLEIESGKNVVLPLIVGDPNTVLAPLPLIRDKRYLIWQGDASEVEQELRKLVRKPLQAPN
jgi:hypothetical protein